MPGSIEVLYLKLTISPKTIRSILLVFCAIMMENCFYLADVENINFLGFLPYRYIWLFTLSIFIACTYFLHRQWKSRVTFHFGIEIVILAVLVFIQAIRGHATYGQSFADGLVGQGCFLFIILSYYPIRKFYANRIVNDNVIDKCLIFFGIIAFIIYILQVLLGESHIFLHVFMNERYGSLRVYADSAFCVFMGLYGMDRFLCTKKWKSLIFVALTVVYELFIGKGRLEFAAFCLSMAIGLIMMKKYKTKKLLAIGLASCLLFAFLNIPYVNEKIVEVIDNLINNTGTMKIRESGREFYIALLLSSVVSMLFGCGYPRTEVALSMAGYDRNILLVDNGMAAFAYVYGAFGVVAIILWFVKMLRMAWRSYKKHDVYIYMMLVIFHVAMMYNITFWWSRHAWTFVIVLMMCKMEHYLYDTKKMITVSASHEHNGAMMDYDLNSPGDQ